MTKPAPMHPACHRCGYATVKLRFGVSACLNCGLESADDQPDRHALATEAVQTAARLAQLLDLADLEGVLVKKANRPDGRTFLEVSPVVFPDDELANPPVFN